MAKRKFLKKTNVDSSAKPASKTAAAKRWITENPTVTSYSEIIAGVKSQLGFDLKSADVSNAKTSLKKSGKVRAVKTRKTRPTALLSTSTAGKSAMSGTEHAGTSNDVNIVSATLNLVAAVGLDQARAIIAGLGK
ncbi:MAG: hypothetical protein JWM11_2945 [Planctomycetaceae bacterium]|nr:hypothetical protein [Planctomycetaceae bacterium]